MDREIKSWNTVLSKNEVDLTDFIKEDLMRITERAESQVSDLYLSPITAAESQLRVSLKKCVQEKRNGNGYADGRSRERCIDCCTDTQ